MAVNFKQVNGVANIRGRRNDDLAASVDLDVDVTGYTWTSGVVSVVDGSEVATCSVSVVAATAGTVQVTWPTDMPAGTYEWFLTFDAPGDVTRKAIVGTFEVT